MNETQVENKSVLRIRINRLWREWWGLAVIALTWLTLIILFAALVLAGIIDAGFDEYRPVLSVAPDPEREKTLWDWMDLLLVPTILASGAALFSWVASKREHEAEERRIEEQRTVDLNNAREIALQSYLDRMSDLIRDGLSESETGSAKRSIARARTLTLLRQLDGQRKGLLMHFLYQSGLIGRQKEGEGESAGVTVVLYKADLRESDLSDTSLPGVHLRGVDLRRANLYGADLNEAVLHIADLRNADLRYAQLRRTNLNASKLEGADLRWATLREASLEYADLGEADLREANLRNASLASARLSMANLCRANLYAADLECSDLSGSNLSGAVLAGAKLENAKVTDEQLAQAASLRGATLPDGTVHE